MKKRIKELIPGDVFIDSFGAHIKVEKIVDLPWLGIPRTSRKIQIFFESGGHKMFMNYRANRDVEVVKQ